MASMYDKLGELLSGALDSGFIPNEEKKSEKKISANEEFSQDKIKTENEYFSQKNPDENVSSNNSNKNLDNQKFGQKNQESKEYEIIKFLPENVKIAFAQIKIPENASFDEAKKIYREKLKLYHPDTKNDNPVLQKVAKEKTENLLTNWKIVEDYFKSQKC